MLKWSLRFIGSILRSFLMRFPISVKLWSSVSRYCQLQGGWCPSSSETPNNQVFAKSIGPFSPYACLGTQLTSSYRVLAQWQRFDKAQAWLSIVQYKISTTVITRSYYQPQRKMLTEDHFIKKRVHSTCSKLLIPFINTLLMKVI